MDVPPLEAADAAPYHVRYYPRTVQASGAVRNAIHFRPRSLDEPVNFAGYTALHEAAHRGNNSLVQAFIPAGADVNRPALAGYTPLFVASMYGHTDIVTMLLDAGADVNRQTHIGAIPDETALFIASMNGHADVVRVLLERGADPTIQSLRGKTPLQVAQREGHDDVVALLDRSVPTSAYRCSGRSCFGFGGITKRRRRTRTRRRSTRRHRRRRSRRKANKNN
jgi:hypothetical protein